MELAALATLNVAYRSSWLETVESNVVPRVEAPVAVPLYGIIWPPGPGPVAPRAAPMLASDSQYPVNRNCAAVAAPTVNAVIRMRRAQGVFVWAPALRVMAPLEQFAVPADGASAKSRVSVPGVVTTVEIIPDASIRS